MIKNFVVTPSSIARCHSYKVALTLFYVVLTNQITAQQRSVFMHYYYDPYGQQWIVVSMAPDTQPVSIDVPLDERLK